MKKILITGGSGFIGTNLIEKLKFTHAILSIDIKKPKLSEHTSFFKNIDICDYDSLNECMKNFQPEIIIHLAARTDLNGLTLDDYKPNILGVENLLKIAESLISLERVIFTSSMYVCYPGYKPANFLDYKPHTVYGESKVLTEKLVTNYSNKPYSWSFIRPTSIWGPYFGEPYLYFFNIVLSKKYFHFGKKTCNKTYGYIENTLYQIECILNEKKENIHQKTFYLGDYKPYNVSEWAEEIAANINFKIPNYPYFVFFLIAKFGDFLKFFNVRFPLTSFRLKNMTTDNVIDLSEIIKICPQLPVSRKEANVKTINWINNSRK